MRVQYLLFIGLIISSAFADDCPVGTYRMNLDASIGGTNYTYDNSTGTWTANLDYGDVSGISTCNSTSGSWATAYPQYNFEQGTSGAQCWCKMTGPARSAWVYRDEHGSASDCAAHCAHYCAGNVRDSAAIRTGMFGSVECESCTNKPANSHYTSNATTNNCSWECDDGYYDNNGTCTLCEAGYMCSGGVKTNCVHVIGPNGRQTYSETTGASSCTECPAITGELASRLSHYFAYPYNIHTSSGVCIARIYDDDPDGEYTINAWYRYGQYGGGYIQTHEPTKCIAGKYSILGNTAECYTGGVDCMKGKVCTDVGVGYYSPDGDTQRYECTNKPEHSHFTCSGTTNIREWECDANYT